MRLTAIIFLFLSWPVTLIHRLYNNLPPKEVNWFAFVYYPQDRQWYVYMTGLFLSSIMMLLSMFFYLGSKEKSHSYFSNLIMLMMGVQVLELINYWLYYGQNEDIITIQSCSLIMSAFFSLIKFRNGTRRKKAKYHGSIG